MAINGNGSGGSGDILAAVLAELPERVYRVRRDGVLLDWWGRAEGRPSLVGAGDAGCHVRKFLAPGSADALLQMVEGAAAGARQPG